LLAELRELFHQLMGREGVFDNMVGLPLLVHSLNSEKERALEADHRVVYSLGEIPDNPRNLYVLVFAHPDIDPFAEVAPPFKQISPGEPFDGHIPYDENAYGHESGSDNLKE